MKEKIFTTRVQKNMFHDFSVLTSEITKWACRIFKRVAPKYKVIPPGFRIEFVETARDRLQHKATIKLIIPIES